MDYLPDPQHKAVHSNIAAPKDLTGTPYSDSEITIFDAYEYQSGRTINPEKNFEAYEAYNELITREAIRQLTEKLLLEIIYLQALSTYYESLYANPRFSSYQYASPYPNSSPYLYPKPEADPYLEEYPPNYSKQPNHSFFSRFISTARHSVGRPVWAFSKFASLCQRGYLGCAATVSELLQEAGLRINGSASVYGVVRELSTLGWHKIKINDKQQFQAGDIVYGLKGSHAHIGIITVADKDKVLVCDNSSSSGTLKERTIESGGSFTPDGRFAGSLYVLRKG